MPDTRESAVQISSGHREIEASWSPSPAASRVWRTLELFQSSYAFFRVILIELLEVQ